MGVVLTVVCTFRWLFFILSIQEAIADLLAARYPLAPALVWGVVALLQNIVLIFV